MASDSRQQHRTLEHQKRSLNEQLQEQIQTAEMYEEGSELDNSKAARMQQHSGNEAIQDLLDQINKIDSDLSNLEQEGMDEELAEEVELDVEHGTTVKGGNDDGGLDDDDPWEQEFFFGGDDDPIMMRRKRKKRKRVTEFIDSKETMSDKAAAAPPPPMLDHILPSIEQGMRIGDARYKAPEMALRWLPALIGHSLKPEELKYRHGIDDPIRLPVELGSFLEREASNEMAASWGEMLAAPDASLLSPQGGFSTAVGRLATLSVCAEAIQGPPDVIDNATQLALHQNVWEHCRDVAKTLAHKGQLHAPKIASQVLDISELPSMRGPLPKPNVLGGAALRTILPEDMAFLVPALKEDVIPTVDDDDFIAELDMILEEFTGGNPFATPKKPVLRDDHIHPALQSTNQLLNALGRTQVESAAAAVAVHRVNPEAPILNILEHCDNVLRKVARRAIEAGQSLQQTVGEARFKANPVLIEAINNIKECHETLQSLKRWSLMTFAASVQYQGDES